MMEEKNIVMDLREQSDFSERIKAGDVIRLREKPSLPLFGGGANFCEIYLS